MLTYVKPSDFEEYNLDITPTALRTLINIASASIRKATRAAVYVTNPAGLPEDEDTLEAFQNATKAQVLAIAQNGLTYTVISGGAATSGVVKSASDNGSSITYETGLSDRAVADLIGGGLCPEAKAYLDDMQLLGGLPGVVGW